MELSVLQYGGKVELHNMSGKTALSQREKPNMFQVWKTNRND